MRYLPLHFDLKGRPVLVVGGGELARRKVSLLLAAGASITLVAPEISGGLAEMLGGSEHRLQYEPYSQANLDNVALVVAATDDESVNRQVSVDAQAANVPVNVVDSPELCTVTFPAIVDRDPIVVSIGSAGGAPVLVRHVRELIETFPPRPKIKGSPPLSRNTRLPSLARRTSRSLMSSWLVDL